MGGTVWADLSPAFSEANARVQVFWWRIFGEDNLDAAAFRCRPQLIMG